MNTEKAREHQCVLFDWGDTVMRVFPEFSGPMDSWPKVEAIEGVKEAIKELTRDALVCLATNAADSGVTAVRNALCRAELETLFDRIFCYEVVGHRKPSALFYQAVLKLLQLEPANVFMVGDDFEVDVEGATAVGISAVWFNQASTDSRPGPGHTTIHSMESLASALEALGFRRS